MCTFPSFPNFALFVFICQFQGFLFGAILVHARRPCLLVHRETTGVLKGSQQCGLDLDCTWELGIARALCEGAYFSIFWGKLWRIGQEYADPGEEQDPRSDGLWWKGYRRGRSW